MQVCDRKDLLASSRAMLLRLLRDESATALVEYCIVMAALTVLMMIAYRKVGTVANASVGNNVSAMTNSSVVVP